jgi:hypothetical protein
MINEKQKKALSYAQWLAVMVSQYRYFFRDVDIKHNWSCWKLYCSEKKAEEYDK